MSGEINLTQDKDGRADKHSGDCIHPALTTGDLTVQSELHHSVKCKATCDTGSWPEQHTSNLQPGLEGIGPARKHQLCKVTLTRRHGGSTGLPIWHLAPSSHQPLRPSSTAAAEAAATGPRPSNSSPKAAASVGSDCPPILNLQSQSQSRAVRLTNKPIVPPESTGRQTWCRPFSHAHASTHPARQSCIPSPIEDLPHPVRGESATTSNFDVKFHAHPSRAPHQTADDLVDDYVPLTSIRVSRPPRLCAATRFGWPYLAAHDRSARTTTISTATQSTLLG